MKKRSFIPTWLYLTGILLLGSLLSQCSHTRPDPPRVPTEKDLLPIEIKVGGYLEEISDRWYPPPIRVIVQPDTVEIIVGETERYGIPYEATRFAQILPAFQLADFQFNGYHHNPSLSYGGYVTFSKLVDSVHYSRVTSRWVHHDHQTEYTDLAKEELNRWELLSNHANELVVSFLRDSVDPDTMITAYSVREALQDPEHVYRLSVRNRRMTRLPASVGQLYNLRILDVSGSLISELPPEIGQCKELRSIIANATPLSTIPAEIGQLKHLRFANFGYCRINKLPEELGELSSLWFLTLGDNRLEYLPASFAQLQNLWSCHLDGNRFSRFPEEVLGLTSMSSLWLHGNQFTTLPTRITDLKQLTRLLIDAQEITNIDSIQALLPGLRIIDEGK